MTYPSALDGSLDDALNDMKGACKLVLTPCYTAYSSRCQRTTQFVAHAPVTAVADSGGQWEEIRW